MDLQVSYKYERPFGSNDNLKDFREGVSFEKLFEFTNKCQSPIHTKKILTQWICINLILGNKDAHGKNISFFINEKNQINLTPFYDITNVALYGTQYEQEFAMAFGDQFREENLTINDFQELCFNCDISFHIFKKELLSLCAKARNLIEDHIYDNLEDVDIDFIKRYKNDVLNRVYALEEIFPK